jgi:hypothetical protein
MELSITAVPWLYKNSSASFSVPDHDSERKGKVSVFFFFFWWGIPITTRNNLCIRTLRRSKLKHIRRSINPRLVGVLRQEVGRQLSCVAVSDALARDVAAELEL